MAFFLELCGEGPECLVEREPSTLLGKNAGPPLALSRPPRP